MRVGASLLLMALGAVLTFVVTVSVAGLPLGAIGVVLMLVAAVGLLSSISRVEPADRYADRYFV